MSDTRQIEALEKLTRLYGNAQDGKILLQKLRRLERSLNQKAVDYCNGDIDSARWNAAQRYGEKRIKELIGNVPGFFVNGDPRGYTLKIDDAVERDVLQPAGVYLHRDWGGYAILAPEKEGKQP